MVQDCHYWCDFSKGIKRVNIPSSYVNVAFEGDSVIFGPPVYIYNYLLKWYIVARIQMHVFRVGQLNLGIV